MANKVNSFQVQGSKYGIEPDYIFDSTPTQGSTNPVTSNGIYEAINGVSLGSSVSYGRTAGSTVGYCSISYGTNNIASGNYTTSIGVENSVYSSTSVACGSHNDIIGNGLGAVALGERNKVNNRQACTAIGSYNRVGTAVTKTPAENYKENIFYGYWNPQNRKLYYDAEMQNEKPITLRYPNNASTYIVDLTNLPNLDRNPGDIYQYNKAYGTLTTKKIINDYVILTDISNNTNYKYKGICYYDNANDKNYSDEAQTQDIESANPRPQYGEIWFDKIGECFIARSPYSGNWPYSGVVKPGGGTIPKWAKVNAYRGAVATPDADRSGCHAYVNCNSSDGSHYGIPYSTSDHVEGTELYNDMIDGQLVVDISSGDVWLYRFDINHNIVFAIDSAYNSNFYNDAPFAQGNCSLSLGLQNFTTGQNGSIVAGEQNKVLGWSEGSCVLGFGNTVRVNNGYGKCCAFISGNGNQISGGSVYTRNVGVLGNSNNLKIGTTFDQDDYFVIGSTNTLDVSAGGNDIHIYGDHNVISEPYSYSRIIGNNNHYSYLGQSSVLGSYNEVGQELIGFKVRKGFIGEDGIITGTGISYNSNTKTYTIETDVIYDLYAYDMPLHPTEEKYIRSVTSNDGTTFVNRNNYYYGYAGLNIVGWNNYFKIRKGASGNGNTILGAYNTLTACNNLNNITLVGYALNCDYNSSNANSGLGAVFTGTLNTMSGITDASFIVGNGTSWDDNDRSNGLVVYRTGAVAAPSAPDTIAGGVTAMANTGTSSDKMLITYAQMRDYTGPGGGGSSRPVATIITLLSTDWSSFEQTIQVSGVKTDSIVIIQPSGSAYAFNHDDIFLKAQANGELTFGCSAGPTVDIDVKVVYWA